MKMGNRFGGNKKMKIIAYLSAGNNLSGDTLCNIEDMKRSFSGKGVNFLIFEDLKNENPYLLKLSDNQVNTIEIYSEMNSDIQMNITDLADALPCKFNFILFDACLMDSVEVAYDTS